MARQQKESYNRKSFDYARKRLKLTHSQTQQLSNVDESTYFTDFRKNFRTMPENLNLVAKALDVSPSYLTASNLSKVDQSDPLYSYWKEQNRIDPEGNIMFPYDYESAIQKSINKKALLLDYLTVIGIRGLTDFNTGNTYYYSRESIEALLKKDVSFERKIQQFLLDYLYEKDFFPIKPPKEVNIIEERNDDNGKEN